jgi:outer membrane protein TolC
LPRAGAQPLVQPGTAAPPLMLEDVLDSTRRNYPPLLIALADADIADAELLAALGKFDLKIKAGAAFDRFGYYENQTFYAGVEQPLRTLGADLYGGYRLGRGDFPTYEGKLETRSDGEWKGGIVVPLFRDRRIDQRRADVLRADIGRAIAKLSIDQQKLLVNQLATRRYYDWLAAGQRFKVAQGLLDLAVTREKILKDAAEAGQIPTIEVTENTRQILQRKSTVVETRRGLELAAIDLSLFYRDSNGSPRLPRAEQLPPTFPDVQPLDDSKVDEDIQTALMRRPEIQRFIEQRKQADVDAQVFRNERLPVVDLNMGFSVAQGTVTRNTLRGPEELLGALIFDLPLQRRTATGKLRSTEAKISQLEQRERFQRDQVVAEVRDAASALRAALDRVDFLRGEVRVARELEQAERDRFQLGDGTLFIVNLREASTAEAEVRLVSAINDYFRAVALYEQAIARGL